MRLMFEAQTLSPSASKSDLYGSLAQQLTGLLEGERDMMAVVLTGRTGGNLATAVRETDVLICVPHDRAARVRETHTLILHCLAEGVDSQMLGDQEMPL